MMNDGFQRGDSHTMNSGRTGVYSIIRLFFYCTGCLVLSGGLLHSFQDKDIKDDKCQTSLEMCKHSLEKTLQMSLLARMSPLLSTPDESNLMQLDTEISNKIMGWGIKAQTSPDYSQFTEVSSFLDTHIGSLFSDFNEITNIWIPVHFIWFDYDPNSFPSRKREGVFAVVTSPSSSNKIEETSSGSKYSGEVSSNTMVLCMRSQSAELKQPCASLSYLVQIRGTIKDRGNFSWGGGKKIRLGWAKFTFKRDREGKWQPVKFEWEKLAGI